MAKTKKQHYIPQFYLKNFSDDKKNIYCIEKPYMNYRRCSIKDTAEENYFYDLGISKVFDKSTLEQREELEQACLNDLGKRYSDLTNEEKDKLDQSIENYLSESIETPMSIIIRKIIDNTYNYNEWVVRNCLFINDKEKYDMSYYLAVSYIRSKSHRDFMVKSFENMTKSILPIVAQFEGITLEKEDIQINYSKEAQKMMQINSITDYEECSKYAESFYSKKWILCENLSGFNFVTCDDPFIIMPTENPLYPWMGTGMSSYGVIIGIPISSRLVLVMYEPKKYSSVIDKKIMVVKDEKRIIDFNLAIIKNAHSFVYANDECTTKMVEELCEKNPDIKEKCIKMLTSS